MGRPGVAFYRLYYVAALLQNRQGMNAAAKTATLRLFTSVLALLDGLVRLLAAALNILAILLIALGRCLQGRQERPSVGAPPRPQLGAAPGRPVRAEPVGQVAPVAAERPGARIATVRPIKLAARPFQLPSSGLLSQPAVPAAVDPGALPATAAKIVETLAHYGVQGTVQDILPGPTVTTYEVAPAAGTRVSKVAGLADDIALALARKVRIVAPIPGKNRIGVEMPNDRQAHVGLRDLIEDPRFHAFDGALPVVLGRDTVGNPVYADLAAMPHVLVAGATGSGKSVGLNVMLLSLLYRRSPSELRLLMIDPKVVELAPFNRIPHMLQPVVTDMAEAAAALNWAVQEMERRYRLFADAGTRNVAGYNAGRAAGQQKLPYIVIVVDEFADLMMQQGKQVESAVGRLAQKARAAGMHVILATQRPSVDVVTGVIKANFPTRIAYRVSQRNDSSVILGEQGAEHLLGMGDALVKLNGASDLLRVQCPWVSEEEVAGVTSFLRSQGEPVYDDAVLQARDVATTTKSQRGSLRLVS
jgi:S-DNA-T family DNA segregation ATPase FtsK/SpoIIIE